MQLAQHERGGVCHATQTEAKRTNRKSSGGRNWPPKTANYQQISFHSHSLPAVNSLPKFNENDVPSAILYLPFSEKCVQPAKTFKLVNE